MKAYFHTLILLLVSTFISAQGSLTGVVVNNVTGQPVRGAIVMVEQTGQYTVTNALGVYNIREVKQGNYNLKCFHPTLNESRTMLQTVANGVASKYKFNLEVREGSEAVLLNLCNLRKYNLQIVKECIIANVQNKKQVDLTKLYFVEELLNQSMYFAELTVNTSGAVEKIEELKDKWNNIKTIVSDKKNGEEKLNTVIKESVAFDAVVADMLQVVGTEINSKTLETMKVNLATQSVLIEKLAVIVLSDKFEFDNDVLAQRNGTIMAFEKALVNVLGNEDSNEITKIHLANILKSWSTVEKMVTKANVDKNSKSAYLNKLVPVTTFLSNEISNAIYSIEDEMITTTVSR